MLSKILKCQTCLEANPKDSVPADVIMLTMEDQVNVIIVQQILNLDYILLEEGAVVQAMITKSIKCIIAHD